MGTSYVGLYEDKELTRYVCHGSYHSTSDMWNLGVFKTSDALEEAFRVCDRHIWEGCSCEKSDRRFQFLIPDMDWLGPVPVCLKCMGIVLDELPDEEWQ